MIIDVTTLGSPSKMEIDDGLSTVTTIVGQWTGNEWGPLELGDITNLAKFVEFCKKEYPNVVMEFDMKEGVKI